MSSGFTKVYNCSGCGQRLSAKQAINGLCDCGSHNVIRYKEYTTKNWWKFWEKTRYLTTTQTGNEVEIN